MYNKILVPLDGSKLAECVLPHVDDLIRSNPAMEVILLRICEPPVIPADYPANMPHGWDEHVKEETDFARQQCSLYLGDMETQLKKRGLKIKTESRLGNPAEQIVDCAKENDVDLIVMASHGRSGISRWAYGSVSEKVLHSTCVPVLMVKAPGCFPRV